MKKLFIAVLFLFPALAFAQTTFTSDLSYGSTGADVSALQEFLVSQHVLAPQYVTGNFYSLTLTAVKQFQVAESISPVSGYVGPITRDTINTILTSEVSTNEGNAATTTPPVDLSQATSTPSLPTFVWATPPSSVTPSIPAPQVQTTKVTVQRNPPVITGSNVYTSLSSTVSAGESQMTFDTFSISVSQGDESVRLNSMPLTLSVNNGAQASDLSGCRLYDASGNVLTANVHAINVGNIGFISGNTITFDLDNSIVMAPGTSATFGIKCDISTSAVSGATYVWSISPNWSSWGFTYGDSAVATSTGDLGTSIIVN